MEFDRLAIFTDCIHFYDTDKNVVTENHIFRRQMQAIATLFRHTTIYCPFDNLSADKVTSIYKTDSIQFNQLPKVGGNALKDKLKILFAIPLWFSAFKKASKDCGIIYQRFPNNLNIPGFFYFYFKRSKVFATYTGSWENYSGEPITYRLQKWLLKNFFRGPVMAYINPERQGHNIFKTFSPSYTASEWEEETEQVNIKIEQLQSGKILNPVFITVGALVESKNQILILNSFRTLRDEGFAFKLYIVGGGPLEEVYEKFITENRLQHHVFLTGKKTNIELRELYRESDFLIQSSLAEGFGKVPLEGLFHGVIPLLNNTGMAAELTGNGAHGLLFSAQEDAGLISLIKKISGSSESLPGTIKNGRAYAKSKTLETWSNNIYALLKTHFE
ncbi:MAG: glycosyltransferase [Panacibacter sp.]